MPAAAPAPLSADLEHGLRRLKLASMRRVAPEMLVTAKTQRWTPEELLRALVEKRAHPLGALFSFARLDRQ